MDRIFESVGDVKPRPVGVEECLFPVETSLKSAKHGIIRGVDHARKVCILIKDDSVLNRINAGIKRSDANSNWSKTPGNSAGSEINPVRNASTRSINNCHAPIRITFP